MLGLFGTLNLGVRSLSAQREGSEIAGHNLANVNNPAYARQRLLLQTALPVPSGVGLQGTGVEAVAIVQVRNLLLDQQVQSETSVRSSLEAQQQGLQYTEANLGQMIDRQASGPAGSAAAGGVGGQQGLAENISDFFNGFQSLSTNPTSLAERQVLLIKAENLSTQFNQVSDRLGEVNDSLNRSVQADVSSANLLLKDIATLNQQIVSSEVGSGGVANDLRDVRQQRLEELAKLTNISTVTQTNGAVDVSIEGVSMVSAGVVQDTLEAFDPGSGQFVVRAQTAAQTLSLTGGSLHGTMDVRDGSLASLRSDIDNLASNLITSVNALHSGGFSLTGATGQKFFTGTGAGDIAVNGALTSDPSAIQASGVAGAVGDNQVALALAQLANESLAALGGQTFGERFGQSVAGLGQSLNSVNTQLENQNIVERMLLRQRDSFSGVSLDEEMTDLMKYQKAFQASAKLITTVDEMLEIIMNLKR
ncbi:MAG: flagellar hook-associated protein FlgK [Pedosphaera sp.]|nr:flagellar hook-associated protein FlgK [Pedosphaera sp.]